MPRRKITSLQDDLVRYCLTAQIEDASQLLSVAASIVKHRAGATVQVPLPGVRSSRRATSAPLAVVPPKGPVKPATAADTADLAAARERANQATGVRDTRPRQPRAARPSVEAPALPAVPGGASAGNVDTE